MQIKTHFKLFQFLCSDCGYGNPLSFKSINDDDIDFVEKEIKEKGESFAKKTQKVNSEGNDEMINDSMDNNDPVHTFGKIYAKCPDKFQFLRGERNFIKIIVAHVQKLVDHGGENKGLAQFKEKKKKKKPKNVNHQFGVDSNAKENFSDSKSPKLTNELYDKVINCLKSYDVDVSGCERSMVYVDPSGAYGNIKCILCDDSNGTENMKRVTYYQPANRTNFWVLSNFMSHLEKKHKLVAKRSKPKSKKLKLNADSNSALQLNEQLNIDDNNQKPHCDIPLNETSQIDSKYILLGEDVIDLKNENKDYSLEIVDVKIAQPAMQPNEISNSWLYIQMGAQIRKMIAAQLTHSECTQQMEIKIKNQMARIIYIIKILGDGNCLFTSLAHQLWPTATTSDECKKNAIKLRADVVEHIFANIESYQRFIEEYLHELKSLNSDDTSLETKCKMWVRHILSRQGSWGGIETIKAVSLIHRVNVVIFDECGIVQMVQGAKEQYDRTILIAYRFYLNEQNKRVYNHYETVCDMESDTIHAASEFIMNK